MSQSTQEELMLPSELVILMAIAVGKNRGKTLLSHPMDVTGEYIGYLYNSLVTRGYLKRYKSSGYQLTRVGREVISRFLNRNGAKAADVMKRLRLLGIDIDPGEEHIIARLKKEAINLK